MCNPNPNPQVLQQQVMYKPRKQKHAKVKAPAAATREDDKECHKLFNLGFFRSHGNLRKMSMDDQNSKCISLVEGIYGRMQHLYQGTTLTTSSRHGNKAQT